MRTRRRTIRRATWLAAALTLVLALLCGPWGIFFHYHRTIVIIGRGFVASHVSPPFMRPSTPRVEFSYQPRGWPAVLSVLVLPPDTTRWFYVPLVPLFAVLCSATITLAIVEHRLRPGPRECRECGYDLTGNTTGRCPECGRVVATAGEATQ